MECFAWGEDWSGWGVEEVFWYLCGAFVGICWSCRWWGHYTAVAFKWFDINPGDAEKLVLLGDRLIFNPCVGLGRYRKFD